MFIDVPADEFYMLLLVFRISPRGFVKFSRRFGSSFGAIFKRDGVLFPRPQAGYPGFVVRRIFRLNFFILNSEDRIGIGLEV